MEYAGCILVEDASGCRFEVHEYLAWRFLSRISRFKLDTGEVVERIDSNNFEISGTGERLVRARESCPTVLGA